MENEEYGDGTHDSPHITNRRRSNPSLYSGRISADGEHFINVLSLNIDTIETDLRYEVVRNTATIMNSRSFNAFSVGLMAELRAFSVFRDSVTRINFWTGRGLPARDSETFVPDIEHKIELRISSSSGDQVVPNDNSMTASVSLCNSVRSTIGSENRNEENQNTSQFSNSSRNVDIHSFEQSSNQMRGRQIKRVNQAISSDQIVSASETIQTSAGNTIYFPHQGRRVPECSSFNPILSLDQTVPIYNCTSNRLKIPHEPVLSHQAVSGLETTLMTAVNTNYKYEQDRYVPECSSYNPNADHLNQAMPWNQTVPVLEVAEISATNSSSIYHRERNLSDCFHSNFSVNKNYRTTQIVSNHVNQDVTTNRGPLSTLSINDFQRTTGFGVRRSAILLPSTSQLRTGTRHVDQNVPDYIQSNQNNNCFTLNSDRAVPEVLASDHDSENNNSSPRIEAPTTNIKQLIVNKKKNIECHTKVQERRSYVMRDNTTFEGYNEMARLMNDVNPTTLNTNLKNGKNLQNRLNFTSRIVRTEVDKITSNSQTERVIDSAGESRERSSNFSRNSSDPSTSYNPEVDNSLKSRFFREGTSQIRSVCSSQQNKFDTRLWTQANISRLHSNQNTSQNFQKRDLRKCFTTEESQKVVDIVKEIPKEFSRNSSDPSTSYRSDVNNSLISHFIHEDSSQINSIHSSQKNKFGTRLWTQANLSRLHSNQNMSQNFQKTDLRNCFATEESQKVVNVNKIPNKTLQDSSNNSSSNSCALPIFNSNKKEKCLDATSLRTIPKLNDINKESKLKSLLEGENIFCTKLEATQSCPPFSQNPMNSKETSSTVRRQIDCYVTKNHKNNRGLSNPEIVLDAHSGKENKQTNKYLSMRNFTENNSKHFQEDCASKNVSTNSDLSKIEEASFPISKNDSE